MQNYEKNLGMSNIGLKSLSFSGKPNSEERKRSSAAQHVTVHPHCVITHEQLIPEVSEFRDCFLVSL